MEPNKEAISVRLVRLSNQFLGRSTLLGSSVHVLKRLLNREGLLDALTVLYDECNNDSLKRSDEQITKFVDKYRCVLTELRRLRVNISDFEVKDIIGRGHFGEVHVIREKHTGDVYAMKTLRKDATLKQKDVTFYEEERDIMAQASSNWITKLQYAFQDSAQLYLVMEFCPGGDLAGLLDRRGQPLPESDACFYLAELNQALNTLHLMGYVHRDIKPDNILIDRCGHLKLADFGSAACISQTGKVTSGMPIGTPDYIAPELLKSMESAKPQSHGTPCDYWSLGIVAYELVTLHTPFADVDKPDSIAHTYNNIMQHGLKCQLVQFPADIEGSLSNDYKDLVQSLLAVNEKKRFGYFETLKHPVFKDIPWNTIRDQVPPFVPIVNAVDDTSHFVEYEKQANKPSLTNFRTRNQFSGRNLPFIGFTYAHEPSLPFHGHNSTHSSSGDTYADSESCSSHAHEDTAPVAENGISKNGFLNSSLTNRTAIHVGNVREMECLLESRKKEIESLQKKLAGAETEVFLFSEKERRLAEAENERGRLEIQITELVVQNKNLIRQLEFEHAERKETETKSLELINAAKKSWMSKTKVQIQTLTANVASHESKARELAGENERLVATVEALRRDLEKANAEIDCMKKLQSNYKDSMAKARKMSRQSIVGLEQMSAESNNQIQTLTQSLNRELETRREIESQMIGLQDELKACQDREKSLLVELEENKKDFNDLKKQCDDSAKLRAIIENMEFELSSLRRKASKAERGENKTVQNLEKSLAKEKVVIETQKKEIKELHSALQRSENALEQQQSAESTLEEQHGRTVARLQEKISAAQQDRIDLQARLDATMKSEERHKDKVADLENLVMRLEQEVSKLELQNQTKPSSPVEDKLCEGKVQLLQEQLEKMEQQLVTLREELLVQKQEARKANTALWKKEKELSERELDKKILTRELKQAEEQLKKVTKEKQSLADRFADKIKILEEKASEHNELVTKLRQDVEVGARGREELEITLREVNGRLDEERKKVEKFVAEVERCKADIRKMKCELQYSENRRLKAEAVVDDLREELKTARALHHEQREEAVRLRVTLDERLRECENMIENNKMLKDACTMLEEQLIDFEKLSEVQENKTESMKSEVATMRAEIDRYKKKLLAAQQQANHTEKEVERALEEKMAAYELETETRKTVNELESRITELQNKITTLTEELEQKHLLLTEGELARASLNRRLSSQASELAILKEECAALRTNVHRLKEENMQVALKLQESEENNATLKCMVEEKRSELETQAAHHRQRELKADATLQQLTKLIDFLQTKIEETGRRKKMFAGMFGKSNGSAMKELDSVTGLPQTPSSNLAELGKNLHKERSRNRELKEQLAMLKHKLDSLQGHRGSPVNVDEPDTVCNTPRSHYISNTLQRSINRESVSSSDMEGWIRIAKGSQLERVYLVLSECRLSWHDDSPTAASSMQLGEIMLNRESMRIILRVTSEAGEVQLSENDRKCAFMIHTESWQQKPLLFVCASTHQQMRWLQALEPVLSSVPAPRIHLRSYEPAILLGGEHRLGVNCVTQLDQEMYVLGTDQGLYSHQPTQLAPLPLGGPPSVLTIRLAPHIGQVLMLSGTRRLAHCGLRELTSRTRRSSGVSGVLACKDVYLDGERADAWHCMQFEMSPARYGTDRIVLCVAGTKKLILMLWDFGKCHFKQLRIMDLTSPVNCLLFTRHTVLVGTNKLYEMDLNSYTTEEFLDASDVSLTPAVYAYKKNSYPMSIIRIKEQKIDDMTEYLICYKEFGFFVDEFGHRTRTEDIKWTHTPLEFSFRKPFLFVLYDDKVDILYIDDKAYQLPPCECNCDTSSVSTFSSCASADKVRVQLENPKFMGKSINQGSIFIKTGSVEGKHCDIIEFNGNDAFRKDIGLSIETLDTAEDNDSCKNVKNNEYDIDSVRSMDSSAECKTDFSANIRKRAKQIVTQYREKSDENKITSILSKEVPKKFVSRSERENCESEGSISDSEFSSDAENSNGVVYADTAAGRLRNGEQVRTTAEICTDMFLKKVRFDKK